MRTFSLDHLGSARRSAHLLVVIGFVLALLTWSQPAFAASQVVILVQGPTSVTSGTKATFTVELQGATPRNIESGIRWAASETKATIGDWDVGDAEGYFRSFPSATLVRNLGSTAVFELSTQIKANYQFELQAIVGSPEDQQPKPLSLNIGVSSPEAWTPIIPPSNVRIETRELVNPVQGTVAFYQMRVAADGVLAAEIESGGDSFGSVKVSGLANRSFFLDISDGSATPWFDVTNRWIDTAAAKVAIEVDYLGIFMISFTKKDVEVPLVFSAANVLEVYPVASLLRCGTVKSEIQCQTAIANTSIARRDFVTELAPPNLTIQLQKRNWMSNKRMWSPWTKSITRSAVINGSEVSINFPISVKANRTPHQIRASIPNMAGTQVIVKSANVPVGQIQWSASNPNRLN